MVGKAVDVHDAQARFAELLSIVEQGSEVTLIDHGVVVARLVPPEEAGTDRTAGLHTGAVQTSEDFDEPLPDAFWAGTV